MARSPRRLHPAGVVLSLLVAGCGTAPEAGHDEERPVLPPGRNAVASGAPPTGFPQPQDPADREHDAVDAARAPEPDTAHDYGLAEVLELIAAAPRTVGAEATRALTQAATTAALAELREEAVFALGDIGGVDAEAAVATALSDPDPRVHEAAVRALTRQGGDNAVHALQWALAQADGPHRPMIVDAIGRIGSPAAVTALQLAMRHEDARVRQAAAEWIDEYRAASPAAAGGAILRP